MTCTECHRRGPAPLRRRGRISRSERATLGDAARDALVSEGWFVFGRDVPVRFSGVVLCPACRQKPTGKDAYGNVYPTSELEELAGGKAWPS